MVFGSVSQSELDKPTSRAQINITIPVKFKAVNRAQLGSALEGIFTQMFANKIFIDFRLIEIGAL